jgi:branched-chain amino acid transport system ATP-binding protein
MNENVLEVRGVMKRYEGLTALRWVDINVPRGSVFSVVGPNGAGKTTLFNCISGLTPINDGEIWFERKPIHTLRPDQIVRRGIARTFQRVCLFNGMPALEQVLIGMHTRLRAGLLATLIPGYAHREEARARADARDILASVGLSGFEETLPEALSYGAQRRLEIARALASAPTLLLLDELAAGMSAPEVESLHRLLHDLRDTRGLTILLIEHDMSIVTALSDYMVVLESGQKIAEGVPTEVRRDPLVMNAYLGQSPETQIYP